MKKIYILAAIALVAGVSCTKQVPVTDNSPDVALSFNAVTGVQTKADITSAVYPTSQDFDVWAVYTGSADFDIGTAYTTDTATDFMVGVQQTYRVNFNAWANASGSTYWPKAGKLSFWALSPTKTGSSYFSTAPAVNWLPQNAKVLTAGWTVTDDAPDSSNDLMFSDIVANKTADDYRGNGVDDTTASNDTGFEDYQGVNIYFHHALSRIEFKAKRGTNVNSNEELRITDIKVNGALPTGALTVMPTATLTEGTPTSNFAAGDGKVVWAASSTALTLNPQNATIDPTPSALPDNASDPASIGEARLVIPQATDGVVSFVVTVQSKIGNVTATKEYTYYLLDAHNGVWEWGKKYIYTMILNEDEIYFDPKVVDWTLVDYVMPDLVVLDYSYVELTAGATKQLSKTVLPTNATDQDVTWSASGDADITVDATGLVTVAGSATVGDTATITVTTNTGGLTASCIVKVVAAP